MLIFLIIKQNLSPFHTNSKCVQIELRNTVLIQTLYLFQPFHITENVIIPGREPKLRLHCMYVYMYVYTQIYIHTHKRTHNTMLCPNNYQSLKSTIKRKKTWEITKIRLKKILPSNSVLPAQGQMALFFGAFKMCLPRELFPRMGQASVEHLESSMCMYKRLRKVSTDVNAQGIIRNAAKL